MLTEASSEDKDGVASYAATTSSCWAPMLTQSCAHRLQLRSVCAQGYPRHILPQARAGIEAPAPTEKATVFPSNPSFLESSFDSCNLSKPLGEKFKVKTSPVA